MNKLNTDALGGVKLDLDDIEFWHNAIADGFRAKYFQIGYDYLTGCALVNGSAPGFDIALSWEEGYLWHAGEFYKIEAGGPVNLSSGGDDEIYLKLVLGFDAAGDELNKTGSPIQTYRIRKATVAVAPVDTANLDPDFVILYNNCHTSNWRTVTLQSGYSHEPGVPLRFSSVGNKTIRLTGQFKLTATTPTGGSLTSSGNRLPAHVRPPVSTRRLVYNINNTTIAELFINANGDLFLGGTTGSSFNNGDVIDVGLIEWTL